ncbi:hypothetical protein EON79_02360 [bacterium]|nr:MAG: hypothetical protein EON79_02360 [bacterium]
MFKPYTNGPIRIPREGVFKGVEEIWGCLSFFWHETEEEEEALNFGIEEDILLESLSRRGIPVRSSEDQHPEDPPTLVALEERFPHLTLGLMGEMMRVPGDLYAFHYHIEAFDFRKVAGMERLQRIVPWDVDVVGCAPPDRLGAMIVKTIDELMEGFAEAFKRDNPQFADRGA